MAEILPFEPQHKAKEEFRVYAPSSSEDGGLAAVVENHYRMMRENQTVEFVKRMHCKYNFAQPRATMTIREAFAKLDGYVDSSDPDLTLPNIIHSYQTAEAIRKAGKPDWMQLVGLIHDMGKLMFLWGTPEDGQEGTATGNQFALGGDTFIVGCRIPDCTVFPQFNSLNPDSHIPLYNTELGMYKAGCGLDNVLFAYGHDEYLYQMLVANKTTIPAEGLAMARFHSAYPWHTGKAYRQFMTEQDYINEAAVIEFNKFDLYTKDEEGGKNMTREQVEELWGYYAALIDKYFPDPQNLIW